MFCKFRAGMSIPWSRRLRCRLWKVMLLFLPAIAFGFALVNSELKVIDAMEELGKKGVVVLEPNGPTWMQLLAHNRYPMWVRRIGWRYGYKVTNVSLRNADNQDVRCISWLDGVESVSLFGTSYG